MRGILMEECDSTEKSGEHHLLRARPGSADSQLMKPARHCAWGCEAVSGPSLPGSPSRTWSSALCGLLWWAQSCVQRCGCWGHSAGMGHEGMSLGGQVHEKCVVTHHSHHSQFLNQRLQSLAQALATGTRCIGVAAMVAGRGQVLHDAHGEVLHVPLKPLDEHPLRTV